MSHTRTYTEKELADAVRAGDREAMHSLYTIYSSMVMGICRRYAVTLSEADDILQNVFVRVFTGIGRFTYIAEGSLGAWIRKIAVNESVAHIRMQRDFVSLDMASDASVETPPDTNRLTAEQIMECVGKLPLIYRTIFNLFVVDGHSHADIGRMLGIEPGASATRLSRAKNMLAKMLENYIKDEQ